MCLELRSSPSPPCLSFCILTSCRGLCPLSGPRAPDFGLLGLGHPLLASHSAGWLSCSPIWLPAVPPVLWPPTMTFLAELCRLAPCSDTCSDPPFPALEKKRRLSVWPRAGQDPGFRRVSPWPPFLSIHLSTSRRGPSVSCLCGHRLVVARPGCVAVELHSDFPSPTMFSTQHKRPEPSHSSGNALLRAHTSRAFQLQVTCSAVGMLCQKTGVELEHLFY